MPINIYDTLLILDGIGVPLYSARNLTQTLDLIPAMAGGSGSLLRRSVRGKMIDLTYQQFQLYGSKITCTDVNAPAFDGIWPGTRVTVYCVKELCYPIGGHPSRPAVSGSERTEGHFIWYRPILDMIVTTFSPGSFVEWQHENSWSLELEERESALSS